MSAGGIGKVVVILHLAGTMGEYMNGKWQIVHSADAQYSDHKSGDPIKSPKRMKFLEGL